MNKEGSRTTADNEVGVGWLPLLDLSRAGLPRWLVYVLAIGTALAFLGLRTEIAVSFGQRPLLILFMFPIILSALLGGLGPGIVATLVTAIGIDYLAIPPEGSLLIGKSHDQIQWGFLIANGLLVSVLSEKLQGARREAWNNWRLARSTQVELADSERRFRSTFDQAAVGIALVAPGGRWLMVNQKLCDIVGYTWNELKSLGFQDITHPDDLNSDLAYVKQMLAGEIQTYSMEKRYLRKDGGIVWINLTVALVRDDAGVPDYFISVIEDIQQRKETEESLHKAEAWYRAVIDSSDDAIIGRNLQGRITSWNPAAESIFGYSAREAIGHSLGMIYPPGQEGEEQRLLNMIRRGERISHYEAERLCKTGRRIFVSVSVSPIRDESGHVIGASKIARDITAQKQAEKAVRDSAAALKEAQRLAGVGNWEWDVRTGEHRWSDEIYRIYGRSLDLPPATYPEVADYFSPESWAALSAAVERSLVEGVAYTCDAEVVRPDGGHRWIVARGEATRVADGNIVNLHGTVQDITERKQAELALRESEGRFRGLVEQSLIGIYVIQDGRFRYVNPGFAAIFGYDSAEELVERVAVSELVSPEDRARVAENVRRRLDGEISDIRYTFTGLRRDGSRMDAEVHGRVVDYRGNPAVIGMVLDITERNRALAALRESEERLQLFIEHAPASLAMFDRQMRYLAVSRRWLDDYRLDALDVIGRSHYEVFPDLPEHWKEIHNRGLAGEVVRADEDQFERSDGSVQWLRWEVRPWHLNDGEVGGIVLFSEDITHDKEVEFEIRRLNAELEQRVQERTVELTAANRELDSFAYAVSHDLRAPLRAMDGFSRALEEDFGNKLEGEAKLYLEQIVIASHKMNDLVEGLLVLSRSTRSQLDREQVDLTAMAEHILAELATQEPERQVDRLVQTDLFVRGDPRMIGIVMQNLLDNAWKYTAKTAMAEIKVYAEKNRRGEWICVADNGAGFDMDHGSKLFQPFQRLHRQEEFPGIGIGLATVQRIVHRHGGRIEAEGVPGQGARFCFSLTEPIGTEEEEPDEQEHTAG